MDRQRLGLWLTLVFAALALVGMFLQVYLIAGVIFGESGWLDEHKDLGKAVHACYALTFFAALLAAWPNWRSTVLPFALVLIGSIQAFAAGGGEIGSGNDAALHAFHGALVPIVFVIALLVAWRAYLALRVARDPTLAT
jgi:hypothetical protein